MFYICRQITGYRYYSVVQIQKALNIVRLKGLGFSLEEIRTMYDSETQRPSIDMLEEKIRSCQEQLQMLIECRDGVVTLTDIMGREEKIEGEIASADLTGGTVVVRPRAIA